jgi:hypothetical protein
MSYEREKSGLEQFTEFVDVLGKHGTPFALVILGFLVIYWSLFSGQSILSSANHFAGMIIGASMTFTGVIFEYKKMELKEKRLRKNGK